MTWNRKLIVYRLPRPESGGAPRPYPAPQWLSRSTSPAIAGGQPVRGERRLDFAPPALGEEERANVLRSLETGWLTTGPVRAPARERVRGLRGGAARARRLVLHGRDVPRAASRSASATGEDDEVLTTPLTWPATANVIVRAGAQPVFVRRRPGDALPRPRGRRRAVTPRTRAIMPVHYAGHPADIAALAGDRATSTACA